MKKSSILFAVFGFLFVFSFVGSNSVLAADGPSIVSFTANNVSDATSAPISTVIFLDWVSTNTVSCSITGTPMNPGNANNLPTSGDIGVTPGITTTYTLTCVDSVGAVASKNVAVTITSSSPSSITVTSPNGAESWKTGTTQDIQWSNTGGDTVMAQLVFPDSSFCYLAKKPASSGHMSVAIQSSCGGKIVATGQYRIVVYLLQGDSNLATDFSDAAFTITAGTVSSASSSISSVSSSKNSESSYSFSSAASIANVCSITASRQNTIVLFTIKGTNDSPANFCHFDQYSYQSTDGHPKLLTMTEFSLTYDAGAGGSVHIVAGSPSTVSLNYQIGLSTKSSVASSLSSSSIKVESSASSVSSHTSTTVPPAGFEDTVLTNFNAYRNPFPDTNLNELSGQAAAELYRRSVIGGFPDGTFRGNQPVNRAEAAKFLLIARFQTVSNATNKGRFPDVLDEQWYTKFVMTAANKGIINGYPDGSFRPANQVNTAEFLKMLSLTFELKLNRSYSYTDVTANDWFASYAGMAEAYNLFPDRSTQLHPGTPLSRQDVAVAIYQYLANR